MKVIIAHNAYQIRGGEDAVVGFESQLLSDHGDQVDLFIKDNDTISSPVSKIKTLLNTYYSKTAYREMLEKIDTFSPCLAFITVSPL